MNCIQLNGDVELIPLILSRVAKRTQGMVCPPNQRTVVHNVPTSVILIAPTLLAVRFTPPSGYLFLSNDEVEESPGICHPLGYVSMR